MYAHVHSCTNSWAVGQARQTARQTLSYIADNKKWNFLPFLCRLNKQIAKLHFAFMCLLCVSAGECFNLNGFQAPSLLVCPFLRHSIEHRISFPPCLFLYLFLFSLSSRHQCLIYHSPTCDGTKISWFSGFYAACW